MLRPMENLKNLMLRGLSPSRKAASRSLSSHDNIFQMLTKCQEETKNPLRAQVKKETPNRKKGPRPLVASLHSVDEEQKLL